jgi:thiamine pyrophosphate-dependent acetolactate synthase large subunit-like protein
MVTVATAFATALCAAGVQRVYGLPGEDHLRVLDALADAGLRYVPAREESAAVLMAATEAAATGAPGVALVTLASYLWSAAEPGRYFTAHALSTMGYALPAANALSLACPGEPALAFMGDGSLLMRPSEISVAAEQGTAPIYVAWLDGALAQIETKQLRQSLRPVGARLPHVEAAQVARAFGGVGVDVDCLADFGHALTQALSAEAPTLIGARVDQSHRADWYELLRR